MAKCGQWQWALCVAMLAIGGCAVTTHDDRSGGDRAPPPAAPPLPTPTEDKGRPAEPELPPEIIGGSYQDREERALREKVGAAGVQVRRNGDAIKLILPANSVFMLNSDQIQPYFAPVLDGIAQVLREYDRTGVSIKGFTDATGSFEHNQQLSERRARSVAGYLMKRQVAAPRIRSAGYGPRYPMAPNDSESGRSRNRRVEIDLTPLP
jgi:outer membrane protein OmpA-like peptidoglycan-associated protein